MRTNTKMGLTLAMAVAVLGALAISPQVGYSADSDSGVDTNSPAYQRAYRDAYNKSYTKSQAAEQKNLEDKESEKQGGCCG